MLIPKMIHTGWFHEPSRELPNWFQEIVESWKANNPDYNVKIWTLRDDIQPILCRDAWEKSFQSRPSDGHWIRSLIFRYEVIAQRGGIFVHPSLQAVQPFGDIFENVECFVSTCTLRDVDTFDPNFIGGIPNHPLWWQVVRELETSFAQYRALHDALGSGMLSRIAARNYSVVRYHASLFQQPTPGDARSILVNRPELLQG